MKSIEILRKENTHANEKVNTARHNFGYENEDVIIGFRYGVPIAMYTFAGAMIELEQELGREAIQGFTLEDCADALLEKLNK